MPLSGEFESSNPALNQLFRNIIWRQKGNYLEVPTDCPQRDERLGWSGDAQLFITTGAYNYDATLEAEGVKFLWGEKGEAIFRVASGRLEFAVK